MAKAPCPSPHSHNIQRNEHGEYNTRATFYSTNADTPWISPDWIPEHFGRHRSDTRPTAFLPQSYSHSMQTLALELEASPRCHSRPLYSLEPSSMNLPMQMKLQFAAADYRYNGKHLKVLWWNPAVEDAHSSNLGVQWNIDYGNRSNGSRKVWIFVRHDVFRIWRFMTAGEVLRRWSFVS